MALQATAPSLRRILAPLALAQFISSFAGSNMNVMLTDISDDLHTTVAGVQLCITLFLLVMAALMIPGGKLTDRWGRKRCFTLGLGIYAVGAVISAVSWGLGARRRRRGKSPGLRHACLKVFSSGAPGPPDEVQGTRVWTAIHWHRIMPGRVRRVTGFAELVLHGDR